MIINNRGLHKMFKTTQRQLEFAQRIADKINAYSADANATVNNKDGFITVSGMSGYRSWLIYVGVRCGLVNLYTKKSVKFWHVDREYRLW